MPPPADLEARRKGCQKSRPASMPTTRAASGDQLLDLPGHLVDMGHAVDRPQNPPGAIIGQDRLGLPAIDLEPRLDRFRPVVGAVDEIGAAAYVAQPLDPRALVALVVARAAALAGEAPGDAVDQRGFIDLDQDHMVERLAPRGEHRVERLGLRNGARKAVEDEAASA